MAIPNLKTKLKNSLKKEIEDSKSGSSGGDKRLLNYFDLDFEQKMTILFVADENGEFWKRMKVHGPNMTYLKGNKSVKVPGVKDIACAYHSSGEECAACQEGFALHNEAQEVGGEEGKLLKAESKKWFGKDISLTTCLVLDAPMEINTAPDGNQVKIFQLPYAVEKIIMENIEEGLVEEDDLLRTPFVIKKTKNQGGKASYENSYFARKMVTEDDLEVFADLKVEPFNFETLDRVLPASTSEEVAQWVETTKAAYDKVLSRSSGSDEDGDQEERREEEDNEDDDRRPSERVASRREVQQKEPEQEEEQNSSDDSGTKKSHLDRLAALRRNR